MGGMNFLGLGDELSEEVRDKVKTGSQQKGGKSDAVERAKGDQKAQNC